MSNDRQSFHFFKLLQKAFGLTSTHFIASTTVMISTSDSFTATCFSIFSFLNPTKIRTKKKNL